ncbi:unnamed protein product [Medioppia subpectinata]|uniref:Metalloendopeptidase n=1 Tax=Medioppia subpectinata TaxID=1979941 RepID=A0A7R9KFY7_9ACAR|nr:unnamed protein product [Medioppia subpectinata]CAG2102669.1 unnamed protein product [Medioppia subpectinata]
MKLSSGNPINMRVKRGFGVKQGHKRLWPNGTVYYYMYIINYFRSRCQSKIGRIGGKQDLQLAPNCFIGRKVTHGLLHALGFKHEHSRPDRDDYVQVIMSNVKPGTEHNFEKKTMSMYKVYTKFDYSSIMLYGKTSFGKNNATTLISKHAPTNDIKYMRIMSPLDIFTLKAMITLDQMKRIIFMFTQVISICYSMVGGIGGKQDLQLAPNCFGRTLIHELLHALGFKHEHSRPDRDNYVEVIWANIKPGKEKPLSEKDHANVQSVH